MDDETSDAASLGVVVIWQGEEATNSTKGIMTGDRLLTAGLESDRAATFGRQTADGLARDWPKMVTATNGKTGRVLSLRSLRSRESLVFAHVRPNTSCPGLPGRERV